MWKSIMGLCLAAHVFNDDCPCTAAQYKCLFQRYISSRVWEVILYTLCSRFENKRNYI